MRSSVQFALRIVFALLLGQHVARADNPVQWTIVEELQRTDSTKTWVSPTAIDLGKMAWRWDYEITKVTGAVNLGVFGDFTQDITSVIPAEVRIGSGETHDLPAVLLDDMIVESESGSSVDIFVEIDNLGFGRAEFSNIMLGTIDVALFGERQIERINLEGNVQIIGYDFGDYNRDGAVDAADYVTWRRAEAASPVDLAADGNNDGQVTVADYEIWRAIFGQAGSSATLAATTIPEPGGMVLSLFMGLAAWWGRRYAVVRKAANRFRPTRRAFVKF